MGELPPIEKKTWSALRVKEVTLGSEKWKLLQIRKTTFEVARGCLN